MNGWPVFRYGITLRSEDQFAIELKAPRVGVTESDAMKHVSEDQRNVHRTLKACGWTVLVSSNVFDVIDTIKAMQRDVTTLRTLMREGFTISAETYHVVKKQGRSILWSHSKCNTKQEDTGNIQIVHGDIAFMLSSMCCSCKRPLVEVV